LGFGFGFGTACFVGAGLAVADLLVVAGGTGLTVTGCGPPLACAKAAAVIQSAKEKKIIFFIKMVFDFSAYSFPFRLPGAYSFMDFHLVRGCWCWCWILKCNNTIFYIHLAGHFHRFLFRLVPV
jgi:hypothetical protein